MNAPLPPRERESDRQAQERRHRPHSPHRVAYLLSVRDFDRAREAAGDCADCRRLVDDVEHR